MSFLLHAHQLIGIRQSGVPFARGGTVQHVSRERRIAAVANTRIAAARSVCARYIREGYKGSNDFYSLHRIPPQGWLSLHRYGIHQRKPLIQFDALHSFLVVGSP